MNRAEFLKACGYACLSGVAISTIVSSCTTTSHIDVVSTNNIVRLNEKEFELVKKGQVTYRKYVILHTEAIAFPICVYKLSEGYKALLMQCTHQGAELQVFGERIVCPAHGSEFNTSGGVEEGPAIEALKLFPIEIKNGELFITLTK